MLVKTRVSASELEINLVVLYILSTFGVCNSCSIPVTITAQCLLHSILRGIKYLEGGSQRILNSSLLLCLL